MRSLADHDSKISSHRSDRGIGRNVVVSASPHYPAAVGVPLLLQLEHLLHVFYRNHRIACLPEQDAGIVPVVNHRIAHDFEPLVPLPAHGVALFVTRGTNLNNAVAGQGIGVHPLR